MPLVGPCRRRIWQTMNKRAQSSSQERSSGHRRGITLETLSAWLALGANLVTIVGLVLVLLELEQNQKLMRAQTRHQLSAGIVTLLLDTADNQQLAGVMYRESHGGPISPAEQYQFEVRSNALLRYWEDVHYQYRMGLYDEEEFDRQRDAWSATLNESQGFRDYWCRVRTRYSPSFANEMNRLLPPRACIARPIR